MLSDVRAAYLVMLLVWFVPTEGLGTGTATSAERGGRVGKVLIPPVVSGTMPPVSCTQ